MIPGLQRKPEAPQIKFKEQFSGYFIYTGLEKMWKYCSSRNDTHSLDLDAGSYVSTPVLVAARAFVFSVIFA